MSSYTPFVYAIYTGFPLGIEKKERQEFLKFKMPFA